MEVRIGLAGPWPSPLLVCFFETAILTASSSSNSRSTANGLHFHNRLGGENDSQSSAKGNNWSGSQVVGNCAVQPSIKPVTCFHHVEWVLPPQLLPQGILDRAANAAHTVY